MKKFVAFALLFASLCVVGCSGDKKSTEIKSGSGATSTEVKTK